MLKIAIIIFREFLEVSILLGIIFAATKNIRNRLFYITSGVMIGIVCSAILTFWARSLQHTFHENGDEIFDVAVMILTIILIGFSSLWMSNANRKIRSNVDNVICDLEQNIFSKIMLTLLIASTIFREGAEIVLYMITFVQAHKSDPGVNYILGFAIGAAGGTIAGIAIYYGLIKVATRYIFKICFTLLVFIAAGLAVQAAGILSSTGLVTSYHTVVWDSSWLISDYSIMGQFLKIMIGYKAKPSGLQIIAYLATLATLFGCAALQNKLSSQKKNS